MSNAYVKEATCPIPKLLADKTSLPGPYIYISDQETGELIVCNKAMRDSLGLGNYQGKKCWEALCKLDAPCPYCPSERLHSHYKDTIVFTSDFDHGSSILQTTDAIMLNAEGRSLHAHYSADVTKHEKLKMEMTNRAYILYTMAVMFLAREDIDPSICNALEMLGQYLNADGARLFRHVDENNNFDCTLEWLKDPSGGKKVSRVIINSDVYYTLCNNECSVLESLNPGNAEQRTLAAALSAECFICSPILTGSKLWGFLEIDANRLEWSVDDISTVNSTANIFSAGIKRASMRDALYQTQETLRIVLNNVPSGIYWKDRNLTYKGCNASFRSFFNLPSKRIVGKTEFDIFPLEIARKSEKIDQKLLHQKKTQPPSIYKLRVANGQERWIRLTKLPIKNEFNETDLVLGVMDDITKEREAHAQLQRRDEQLERAMRAEQKANRAKSEFLSHMSHEMRTPLNAILGMTHIAKESSDLQKIMYCLENIEYSCNSLLSGMNNVLDFSKIEADKLELAREDFNLERLLENVLGIVTARANEKNIGIRVSISPDIPSNFLGDEVRLRQVFTNLLTNAVKFTPDNGTVSLDIRAAAKDGDATLLQIIVADTGIGMSGDMIENMFVPFAQENAGITKRFGGTGLGLPIVKRIMDKMHGSIEVESELDTGTRFVLKVKLQHSQNDERLRLTTGGRGRPRILIADAYEEDIDEFCKALSNQDVEITKAYSIVQAVNILERGKLEEIRFDAVFVDAKLREAGSAASIDPACVKRVFGKNNTVLLLPVGSINEIERVKALIPFKKILSKPFLPYAIVRVIAELPHIGKAPLMDTSNLSGKWILLVEDVSLNKEIICSFLQKTNVSIDWAQNGLEALEKYISGNGKYDLVLMDVQMPVMNGIDATKLIRKSEGRFGPVPIIALTAGIFQHNVDEFYACGMNDYLPKPVDPKLAVNKIAGWIHYPGVSAEKGNATLHEAPATAEPREESLPYIDFEGGLKTLEGNLELYEKLLKSFMDSGLEAELTSAWADNDSEKTAMLLHRIKGSAGNLSLKRLFDLSSRLNALTQDGGLTQKQFYSLAKCLSGTVEHLRGLTGGKPASAPESSCF